MGASTYPVHVRARLDPGVSRGLWLVKWLLVIPHYVVLAFLWVAFAVLSLVALVAILFTGRYPRAIFEFNVGVLRWSWRVAYYAYGALATDQYPPFSLQERPDYPAHLDVDYPEHLSRGLVLVKTWLLAIPHYLVVGVFLGGGLYVGARAGSGDAEPWRWGGSGGLIGLLALVAAVVLLFTGRYPQSMFDLILGMNRWVLRVAGYAALMTDDYPPFRLDQGEDDGRGDTLELPRPTGPAPGRSGGPGAIQAQPPQRGAGGPSVWTAGRVVAAVSGSLLLVASLGVGAAGGMLARADTMMRDGSGFVSSREMTLASDTYAVTSDRMDVRSPDMGRFASDRLFGTVKVSVTPAARGAMFVGVAPTGDVEAYLAGVEHATLVGFGRAPDYRVHDGGAPRSAPTNHPIWVAQATGTGRQTLRWNVTDGDWTLVVMNADGSRGIDGRIAAAATLPVLHWAFPGLLVVGGTGLLLGLGLLLGALRATRRA
jgi:Domain of unknown function (DUF4389)